MQPHLIILGFAFELSAILVLFGARNKKMIDDPRSFAEVIMLLQGVGLLMILAGIFLG